MQGDLISRSALIKHLTDWRLQEAPYGICEEETETYKTICECIEAVKEQPCAYSVERVVDQIHISYENFLDEIIDNPEEAAKIDFMFRQNNILCGVVRNGGKE